MIPPFPRMLQVRQKFPVTPPLDIAATLRREFAAAGVLERVRPGARIAVAVGSRGITNLSGIVCELLTLLKAAGAQPYLIPAMGSHGGATPDGQLGLLRDYGVTEERVGVPIHASMEVQALGRTAEGIDVYCSSAALQADGIVALNRVKPHTDFRGQIGSGVLKMLVIGLGKQGGAASFHRSTCRIGYEQAIRSMARVVLQKAPVLCGVALVEDQRHETARLAVLKPEEIETREEELFVEAARLVPGLPFSDIDLLIVDRLGKNISGAGMDLNLIGRAIHGYSSFLGEKSQATVLVRRVFVRELTPETHGNANGIGFADFTTTRLVALMDKQASYVNALTSLTPNSVKIPIHFETDREVLTHALASLALMDTRQAKVVRIADTLFLEHLDVSEAYAKCVQEDASLEALNSAEEMGFDATGNLHPLR